MSTTTTDSWSISVKAIGGSAKRSSSAEAGSADDSVEKNFTVTVSPEDDLTSLYDQIEDVTGIKASQQRLIYRGRLIGGSNHEKTTAERTAKLDVAEEQKIKDIAGLGDGQTIHLVRRQASQEQATENETEGTGSSSNTLPSASTSERDSDSLSGNGTASLLAALIGPGLEGNENLEPSTNAGQRQRFGWRSSRLGRNRLSHYRLTSEDLEVPDPGSLEPTRQNLMTLHTLLPHAFVDLNDENLSSPLEANRQWYRGQWIDCRDTVNQWLEATIIEIVRPDDILPPREIVRRNEETLHFVSEPASDPAVSANDLDGRRKLLLEPCDEGDIDDEGGELSGFKRRASNEGVQLLLIHYNGWPHRWDEWVRSDSERIRPFRTRTRHPSMSTHASPTPQSVFNEAPSTVICDEDVVVERAAILPELNRVVASISGLLSAAATEHGSSVRPRRRNSETAESPWARDGATAQGTVEVNEVDAKDAADVIDEVPEDVPSIPPVPSEPPAPAPSETGTEGCSEGISCSFNNRSRQSRRQLELLAPLLDRLGRVLIDAAPHVAAMSTSIPDNDTEDTSATAETDAPTDPVEDNPSTLGGLLSLLGRDRRRQSNAVVANDVSSAADAQDQTPRVDPDYLDFATGSVNTTRGEVRSGPRGRGQNDDVTGLLGAYLAAASLGNLTSGDGSDSGEENANIMGLGRLLRERGNNGGGAGIDIHIHAVVTAPGAAPGGGLGLATLGGGPTVTNTATRNVLSPARERRGSGSLLRLRTPSVAEEDDLGLFSELYSENPAPVNPNSSQDSQSDGASGDDDAARSEYSAQSDGDFLARLASSGPNSGLSVVRNDSFSVSPSRTSSSDGSTRRSSTGNSPRRSNVLGRFFRRSRRSNS